MTKWRPIETVPKDGTDVLVFESGYVVAILHWHSVKTKTAASYPGYWTDGDGLNWYNPTHWMPLPEPPSQLQPSAQKHEHSSGQHWCPECGPL